MQKKIVFIYQINLFTDFHIRQNEGDESFHRRNDLQTDRHFRRQSFDPKRNRRLEGLVREVYDGHDCIVRLRG